MIVNIDVVRLVEQVGADNYDQLVSLLETYEVIDLREEEE